MGERCKAYYAALALVEAVDPPHPFTPRLHFRNRRGVLLLTLPEVVDAILANDLADADDAPASDVGLAA